MSCSPLFPQESFLLPLPICSKSTESSNPVEADDTWSGHKVARCRLIIIGRGVDNGADESRTDEKEGFNGAWGGIRTRKSASKSMTRGRFHIPSWKEYEYQGHAKKTYNTWGLLITLARISISRLSSPSIWNITSRNAIGGETQRSTSRSQAYPSSRAVQWLQWRC